MTRAFRFCFPAVLVLCTAASVAAQQAPPARPLPPRGPLPVTRTAQPTFELSGGYQLLHLPDQTFPFGLNVDAAKHYGAFGLVAEVGFAHDSEDIAGGTGDASATAWNFGAGGRWTKFGASRLWPFAQVLLGAEVLHARAELAGIEDSDTDTSFMLQPGVGVNFVVGDGWGIVGQIDYRRTFFDEPENTENSINNQFRVFIGARLILD
jgi:outer membrane protein with beta-barrel domain